MRLLVSVCAAVVLGMGLCSAHAEMQQNYSDWNRLGAAGKAGYAAGLFDALLLSNDPNAVLSPAGLYECSARLKFTPDSLAQALDGAYAQGVTGAPNAVFSGQLLAVCRSDLNAIRRAKGLPPLPQ